MTSAGEFHRFVARQARLASPAEAAAATRDVLRSIAQVVDPATLDALRVQLPPEIAADLADVRAEADPLVDREVFIGRMVNRFDTMDRYDESLGGLDLVSSYADDDAATRTAAVFAALRASVDGPTAAAIERALPPEIAAWWRGGRR